MANYQYEILKMLASLEGRTDVAELMDYFTKDLHDTEKINVRHNVAYDILTMHEEKYIQTNFSPNTDLFKYFDNRAWTQESEDEFGNTDSDKKITITDEGLTKLKSLKELYDPSPPIIPQQNTYITTHGHNSPAAGHDLIIRDIKTNDESSETKELHKKTFVIHKWILIVAIIAVIVSIVLWQLTK